GLESKVESSDNLLSSNGSPRPIPVRRRQSVSCGAPQDVDENGEPVISFGEPLH
ncbi:hypothetical protein LPJ66_010219, partial [Kickxella alabastrina]